MNKLNYRGLTDTELKNWKTESKKKFAEIYEKTLEILGMGKTAVPCSGGAQKCWEEILSIWVRYADKIGCDVLYASIYHIAWDRYPVAAPSKALVQLLVLVEQALLNEGFAHDTWSECRVFWDALKKVKNSTYSKPVKCRSACFSRYIRCRMQWEIVLKNCKLNLEMENISWEKHLIVGSSRNIKSGIVSFECAIKRLLPAANGWAREEWSNEVGILDEIHKVHGIDFTQDYEEFDNLIYVIEGLLNGNNIDRKLMLLKQVPDSILSCIWPQNTQKNVEDFFVRICERTSKQVRENPKSRSKFRKDVVVNSWVYREYENGTRIPSQEVRKHMFNVMLGV